MDSFAIWKLTCNVMRKDVFSTGNGTPPKTDAFPHLIDFKANMIVQSRRLHTLTISGLPSNFWWVQKGYMAYAIRKHSESKYFVFLKFGLQMVGVWITREVFSLLIKELFLVLQQGRKCRCWCKTFKIRQASSSEVPVPLYTVYISVTCQVLSQIISKKTRLSLYNVFFPGSLNSNSVNMLSHFNLTGTFDSMNSRTRLQIQQQ